jgi:hypothetical protein
VPPSRRFGPPRARLVLVACALLALGACGDGPAPGPQAATPAVGARAPAVSGLPPGPAIVVFYRGHW